MPNIGCMDKILALEFIFFLLFNSLLQMLVDYACL